MKWARELLEGEIFDDIRENIKFKELMKDL